MDVMRWTFIEEPIGMDEITHVFKHIEDFWCDVSELRYVDELSIGDDGSDLP